MRENSAKPGTKMVSKRQANNNLLPESRRCFRLVCIEWAKRFANISFVTSEDEVDFFLEKFVINGSDEQIEAEVKDHSSGRRRDHLLLSAG